MPLYTFERTVGGVSRRFAVQHDPLFDRVAVDVDGAPVPTKLVRRPFSNLWRHTFTLDGEALEVRVRASGLRGHDVSLNAPNDGVAPVRSPVRALAWSFVAIPLLALVVVPGPVTVRAVIGIVAGAVTVGIIAVVYRRS